MSNRFNPYAINWSRQSRARGPQLRNYGKRLGYKTSYKGLRTKISKAYKNKNYGHLLTWNGMPFPPKMLTKFSYADTYSFDASSTTMQVQTFRLNGLFDPDFTGVGHQPKYYDTLVGADGGNAPYLTTLVKHAKATIEFINGNSSGGTIGFVGARIRRSTAAAFTDADVAKETPYTKVMTIGPNGNSKSVRKWAMHCDIHKLLECKDIEDCEEAYAGYNANPTEQIYLDVFYQSLSGVAAAVVYAQVKITYDTMLMQRNTVVTS